MLCFLKASFTVLVCFWISILLTWSSLFLVHSGTRQCFASQNYHSCSRSFSFKGILCIVVRLRSEAPWPGGYSWSVTHWYCLLLSRRRRYHEHNLLEGLEKSCTNIKLKRCHPVKMEFGERTFQTHLLWKADKKNSRVEIRGKLFALIWNECPKKKDK